MKRLFAYLRPFMGRMSVGLAIKIAGTLVELALPYILGMILNEIIKDYADGKRVVWHDFTERFLGPDGEFKPGLMIGDLLHPHHGGYELWRDAVMPKFAELLAKP